MALIRMFRVPGWAASGTLKLRRSSKSGFRAAGRALGLHGGLGFGEFKVGVCASGFKVSGFRVKVPRQKNPLSREQFLNPKSCKSHMYTRVSGNRKP